MLVQRIKIENWKNFKKVDVAVRRRQFLIGPNASGKSNFLDVFRFLKDICAASGGGFIQAIEKRGGVSAIRALSARKTPDITIEVELADENDQAGVWKYVLSFSQDNNSRPIIKREEVLFNGNELLARPDSDDQQDVLRLTQTALEQLTANHRFRDIVKFFENVSYQHLIPQVIRDPAGFSVGQIKNDPFGRDFLQRVESTPKNTKGSRLAKIVDVLEVAAPQLKELSVTRDAQGVAHLVGLFEHWRPGAGKQTEAQFSDGTLRLFGLLWALFEGDGMLLMEEPELSLHPAFVRHLPQMIERILRHRKVKRQVIISTHSDDMLSDPGINGNEVLRLEPGPEGTLAKSPMDDPEEKAQLESGLTIADVVLPKSAPKKIHQLDLLFDK